MDSDEGFLQRSVRLTEERDRPGIATGRRQKFSPAWRIGFPTGHFPICEDRYQVRSTILTSQPPVSQWHEQIGDPTLSDGILDRLVHNAHRIEMRGDSMRKNRGKPNA